MIYASTPFLFNTVSHDLHDKIFHIYQDSMQILFRLGAFTYLSLLSVRRYTDPFRVFLNQYWFGVDDSSVSILSNICF